MSNAEIPLDGLTIQEKLHLMERIWTDLSQHPNDLPSPEWHRDILAKRREALLAGETQFEDWETVKQRLFNRYK